MRRSLIVLGLLATPVVAADSLPLARGAYVVAGAPCDDPPNAVVRDYNGRGIGSRNAGQCEGRVLAKIGARYTLQQSCVQYGTRPGMSQARMSERLKIRVDSPTAFTDINTRVHYRLCRNVKL